jgi:hypothetical protein
MMSDSMFLWQKRKFVKDMWETNVLLNNETELLISIYGIKTEKEIEGVRLVKTALCVLDTLHLWEEKIIGEVVALSREWVVVSEDELRGKMTLSNVLFDKNQQLSAIYLDTPCFLGHKVVVEFDKDGEPYEAEITS